MTVFKYQGRDANGNLVKGKSEADSSDVVAAQLMQNGITPVLIEKATMELNVPRLIDIKAFFNTVDMEVLIAFCWQMNALIKAGVPILQALTHLMGSSRSKALTNCLRDIVNDISSGKTFTLALEKHPKIFPPVFVSVIDAGESSGHLDTAFLHLADYLAFESKTIKRIKTATRYPLFVMITIFLALLIVNFMVIPSFAKLFQSFGSQLPLPTRILIGTSNLMVNHWVVIFVVLIVACVSVGLYLKTESGRFVWDKWKLKLPVVGNIIYRVILARFARTFSLNLSSGMPLIRSIELVSNVVGNSYIRSRVLAMRDNIERGESLTKSAASSKLFSPMVLQMISVGEETGTIDALLQEVADFYENEVDYDLNRIGDLIQPILISVLGVMVLMLALGVFLPMWDLIQVVQR